MYVKIILKLFLNLMNKLFNFIKLIFNTELKNFYFKACSNSFPINF